MFHANVKKIFYFFCILDCFLAEKINLHDFPQDFLIGFATSSYQVEGGWNADGKGENVWDRLVHSRPYIVIDKSNGDIACDSYHKYTDDVKILKDVGAQVYRFSFSWSRIFPTGDISKINPLGIKYYNNLINELISYNIQPMVTLFHWDLPQQLQNLGGWPNPILIDYFEDYAKFAFQTFGDRVKWWITFNEPLEICHSFYGECNGAPCFNMTGIADYLCAHTIIKSHARAFHIYHNEFQKFQKGKIGISLNGGWNEPLKNTTQHIQAAQKSLEFSIGWFLHPILGEGGDYPKIMKQVIDKNSQKENRKRSRLPYFSENWKKYISGTLDFLGINHYSTYLVSPTHEFFKIPSYERDLNVSITQNSSWPDSASSWLKVEPLGFRKKLNWLKNYTKNFPIFITENGYSDKGELDDLKRINYYKLYLKQLSKAIKEDGCNVIGYIAWSLMDNFEWLSGYTEKFGIYHVDFKSSNLTRTPKSSVQFFKELIESKNLEDERFSTNNNDIIF